MRSASTPISFESGLKAALREDPDVILIGEMRDMTTIDTGDEGRRDRSPGVLDAAYDERRADDLAHHRGLPAARAADGPCSVWPNTLVGVISQRLLPKKEGKGRVVAAEIMVVTGTIRDAILDKDRVPEIYDLIADGREQYGSQTFDQHLMDLVHQNMITFETAMAAASNPSDFELKMRTLA